MAEIAKFLAHNDVDTMAAALANQVANDLRAAIATMGRASLAVPGGTTPGPFFDHLSHADLDWAAVSVLLTDERWLPLDYPRSNTGLLRARLLQNNAAAANLVPLYCDGMDVDQGALALCSRVESVLPLSVCVLGMGTDMHTASLFPDAGNLLCALESPSPVHAMRAPNAPEPRVSLSAAAINSAPCRYILITGDEKRTVLERAQSLPASQAPIMSVLSNSIVYWAPQ